MDNNTEKNNFASETDASKKDSNKYSLCPYCNTKLILKISLDAKPYWICSNTDCQSNDNTDFIIIDPIDKAKKEKDALNYNAIKINEIYKNEFKNSIKDNIPRNDNTKIDDELIKSIYDDLMLHSWIDKKEIEKNKYLSKEESDISIIRKWWNNKKNYKKEKKWKDIGEEIFERKTLTFAAALDLQNKNINNPFKLAATDVFVEKAQRFLTTRARNLLISGILASILAISILVFVGKEIFDKKIFGEFGLTEGKEFSNYLLTIIIVKSTSAGAFVIAAVYFLISLSRALFHEATVLYNRRHALRFGRLYVYMRNGDVGFDDLEKAFKWNDEFTSAFKDIQADKITKTVWMKILETPAETIKSFMDMLKQNKDIKKNSKKKKPNNN